MKLAQKYSKMLQTSFYQFQTFTQQIIRSLVDNPESSNIRHQQIDPLQIMSILTMLNRSMLLESMNPKQDLIKEQQKICVKIDQQSFNHFLLGFNAMRSISIYNFAESSAACNFAQNQICTTLTMLYATKINQIKRYLIDNEDKDSEHQNIFRVICKTVLMNQVMLKMIQRSKQLVPQYFVLTKISVNLVLKCLFVKKQRFNANISIDQKYQNQFENFLKQFKMRVVNQRKLMDEKSIRSQQTIQQLQFLICDSNNLDENLWQTLFIQIVKQFSKFISIFKKNQFIKLACVQNIKETILSQLKNNYPQNQNSNLFSMIKGLLIQTVEEQKQQDVYLQQLEYFKQLTPRIITEEASMKVKLLKKKKAKLEKKIINDMKTNLKVRVQEDQILNQAKMDRIKRIQKKQMFVMQKQTQEAKKHHNATKKLKKIRKGKK